MKIIYENNYCILKVDELNYQVYLDSTTKEHQLSRDDDSIYSLESKHQELFDIVEAFNIFWKLLKIENNNLYTLNINVQHIEIRNIPMAWYIEVKNTLTNLKKEVQEKLLKTNIYLDSFLAKTILDGIFLLYKPIKEVNIIKNY